MEQRLKLNHVDLVVADIPSNRDFLERWFGLQTEVNKDAICLMRDPAGLLLILRTPENGDSSGYPRDFHLGFFLPEEETVTDLYARMVSEGVKMRQPIEGSPPKFRCLTEGGLLIEVAHVPGTL
jgi:catechol 2,3-dioxygenase-like lactoylglutathione lyase family enzyme